MDSKQRCETCKWFDAHGGPSNRHECTRDELEIEDYDGHYFPFQPPSPDFGCTLWATKESRMALSIQSTLKVSGHDIPLAAIEQAIRAEPAPLLEPYDWGPGGMPEGVPIRYEPGKGWKAGE